MAVNQDNVVDLEWVQLILEAKEIGIPINEIKIFLEENK
ncbi:anti-repressor SinI family protein [Priestia aryabhattai]